jgi:AraC-like DNA-binding protein
VIARSPLLTYASTDPVAAEQRLAYWDEYNAAALIGLRTSSLSESGLTARQTNGALHTMHVAEIEGNDHAIERTPRLIGMYPKESVFACHLLKGSAYFVQGGKSLTVNAFETLIYDTRRPFTFGFLSDMHELLVDIPVAELVGHWGVRTEQLPLKVVPTAGVCAAVGAELRRALTSYLHDPSAERAESVPARTHTLLRSMVQSCTSGSQAIAPSVFNVLAAKSYIAKNLGNPELTPSKVALEVGVSVRHLNRLFAAEKTSLAGYIWAQRTTRAHRDLITGATRKVTIGDIAFRWGFSSQAHFCRTIVARYGATPSDLRQSADMSRGRHIWHPVRVETLNVEAGCGSGAVYS